MADNIAFDCSLHGYNPPNTTGHATDYRLVEVWMAPVASSWRGGEHVRISRWSNQ